MSARKRNNKWWIDFRFNRTRYRKPSPENSRAGAQAYEALLRQKLVRGEDISHIDQRVKIEDNKRWSFTEFSQKWLDVYVKSNNKHSEIYMKQSTLRANLVPFFGQKPIDKISNLDIEEYKTKKLKSGLCNKTINNHLTILSRCLRTAQEWEVIQHIPKIKLLKVPPQKYDFLTEAESRTLLESAEGILYEMILTALKTGLRFGELIALEWSDIDFERRTLTVRQAIVRGQIGSTKSNKVRYIPLTNEVSETLAKRARKKGFVFIDRNNTVLKQDWCLNMLHGVCRKAGLRTIGWHTLRHTFASHLAKNNVPMKAIQELLGHSDIITTMRYSHVSHSTLRDAVRTLEGSICGHNMVTIGELTKSGYSALNAGVGNISEL